MSASITPSVEKIRCLLCPYDGGGLFEHHLLAHHGFLLSNVVPASYDQLVHHHGEEHTRGAKHQ